MKVYSVATGRIKLLSGKSRRACKFITKLDGFVSLTPVDDYTLWFFESEKKARIAKVKMQEKGIEVGNNICEFEAKDDFSEAEFIRGV